MKLRIRMVQMCIGNTDKSTTGWRAVVLSPAPKALICKYECKFGIIRYRHFPDLRLRTPMLLRAFCVCVCACASWSLFKRNPFVCKCLKQLLNKRIYQQQ